MTSFTAKVEAAIGTCFGAFIKCDQQLTTAKAKACRANLVLPGVGICAVGKLDEGIPLAFGPGTAEFYATNYALNKTKLILEFNKMTKAIGLKCIGVSGVDLSQSGTGFNFSPTPTTAYELSDALNTESPFGATCQAIARLANTYGLVDDVLVAGDNIVNQLQALNNVCVRADNPVDLYTTACTINADCGVTSQICGKPALTARGLKSMLTNVCGL